MPLAQRKNIIKIIPFILEYIFQIYQFFITGTEWNWNGQKGILFASDSGTTYYEFKFFLKGGF